jgi:Zn-dependent protease with chaperone function
VSTIGILILAALYFLPALIAWTRKNHTAAIFALNLFLGWTVIGWVIALVMALWSSNAAAASSPPAAVSPEREMVSLEAARIRRTVEGWWHRRRQPRHS